MKKVFPIVIAAVIICSSCKKEAANNACSNTVTNLAGTYSIVKVEANITVPYADITNQYFRSCQRDDKIELAASGTATYTDAGTACDPNGTVTGAWSLSSSGKVSLSAGSVDISDADIVSFDCTTLVLLYSTTYLGGPVDLRITVKK